MVLVAGLTPRALSGECLKGSVERPVSERVYGRGEFDLDGDGKPETIEFVLVTGTVSWDACGMFTDTWYEGQMQIRVRKDDRVLSILDFREQEPSPGHRHALPVDRTARRQTLEAFDLTHDGRIEIPILWDADSNDYKLLALAKDGTVEMLTRVFHSVDGFHPLSTDGFVPAGKMFLVYNSHFPLWHDDRDWSVYRWDGKDFVEGDRSSALKSAEIRDIAATDPVHLVASYLERKSYSAASPNGISAQPADRHFRKALEIMAITPAALARNEIYARHGYSFTKNSWAWLFSRVQWYKPEDEFNDASFSPEEKAAAADLLRIDSKQDTHW